MSRRALIKTHRIAPGVYLSVQARSQDTKSQPTGHSSATELDTAAK
ncbi:hypothetical protein V2H26_21705 [Xanthomonas euvesicatoria]|nr:hypothetical protein [Xanthomonas axonopodis]MEE5092554.1 hypothetical protein [Xanthomonas euvesicatoria]